MTILEKLHRDSHPSAAAVEARLREVRPGSVIVQRRDGSVVVCPDLAAAENLLDLDDNQQECSQ